ncbi:(2Fe-2S) ferredoxin domain-containing protein [Lentisphaerota bacterium ZTH]|nr:(2Fe-2S) ferredoxin domain-containing protein [Lentisphaerota bacterium]WET07453.1 (2Fe-2S) ferredoxin domain-containing protein [Lentisphaerota bacterium ZTH]
MAAKIIICMGSSCFARGNEENLKIIEQYIAENGLEAEIDLKGSCCEGQCSAGPNLNINGEMFHGVEKGTLIDLLNYKLK